MDTATKQKIFDCVQKETSINLASIDPNNDFLEQANLDSMQFVSVMARLEKEFDIEIPISAMESNSLNDFLLVLEAEISKKSS
jgi:acyl carrier protein